MENFPPLKNDLILRAARGELTERVPVWCHRQAGRYLPEFRETRKQGDFFTICQTPDLATEITLQPIRRYDHLDAAIIFSDILVVPQALGLECQMITGKGPVFPDPLVDASHLSRLHKKEDIDVNKSLGYVFQALTQTRHQLKGKVPLLGFAGAPWTLMAYMVEGSGQKSYNKARAWMYKTPNEAHQLLSLITEVTIDYLIGQVKAGAQMLEIFDSWAGDLSPELFTNFAFPYLKRIASGVKQGLKDQGLPTVPMTVFAKGATFGLTMLANDTEYDVLALDWSVSPQEARKLVGDTNKTLQGNLDPSILFADPEVIRAETDKMVTAFGSQRYIANLGHGMLPQHTPELLGVFLEQVHVCSEGLVKENK